MRALISVSDKTGVTALARGLVDQGWEIFSTGGTLAALRSDNIPAAGISDLTAFPEILDGRVKTLHPAVHGGILARRGEPAHRQQLADLGIGTIDLVCVNLYPFQQTVARPDVRLEDALEQIDIGGPTLLRAAAKNYPDVLVVTDPGDYQGVLESLAAGSVPPEERRRLAQQAFRHTAQYDTAIADYLRDETDLFPERLTLALDRQSILRYGENPHQSAALYADQVASPEQRTGIVGARQLAGKEMSYNNIVDLDAALGAVLDFAGPAIAIIKHTNPCGLSTQESLTEAYHRAFSGDPVSAFGGIVAANRFIDRATAEAIRPTFYDALIAPGYEPEALEILKTKRNCLIVEYPSSGSDAQPAWRRVEFRRVSGGFLAQSPDLATPDDLQLQIVTRSNPTRDELDDQLFAWRVVKHVKSNAIVIARDQTLLGMGAGQPNRVTSVRLAVERAGERVAGSVLASDAFFPFPDGVEVAAEAGVRAVIQPGGSIRDEAVIEAADRYGIAMILTGRRHFRH